MAAESSNQNRHYLRPWIISAWIWGILCSVILEEYKRKGDPLYLQDIFLMLTLLWAQFGFAGLFNALYSRRYNRLSGYAAITIVPPLILYVLVVW